MASIERPHVAANGRKSWRVVWRYDGKPQRGPRLTDYREARTMALAIDALGDRISAQDERVRSLSLIHGEPQPEAEDPRESLLGYWLDRVITDARVSAPSLRAYQQRRRNLRRWDREDVRTWTQRDSQRVADELLQRMRPRTVDAHMTLLQTALTAASREGAVVNVPRRAKVLGADDRVGTALTQDQALRLLDSIDVPRARDAAQLALASGLRIGEVLALRVDDLRASQVVMVDETVQDSQRDVSRTKTRQSERPVKVDGHTWAMLLRRAQGLPARAFLFAGMGRDPLRRPTTAPVRAQVRRATSALAEQGHLPEGVRFHDLRHTHGSLLLDNKISVTSVAERLGHTVTQLAKVYAHTGSDVEDAMAAIAGAAYAPARTRLEVVA